MSVIAVEGAGGFSPCSHSTADSERRPLFLFSVSEGLVAFIGGMSFGHFLVDFVVTLATFCLSLSRCKLALPRDPGTLYYLCLGPSQQWFGLRLSFPRPLGHAVLFVSTW